MNYQNFYRGQEFDASDFLGAHVSSAGTIFRVFAPAARRIEVIGEFNDWKGTEMSKIYDGNFWECEIPGARHGQMYKYRIYGGDGTIYDRADPYAFTAQLRPETASIIWDLSRYTFKDKTWMKNRSCDLTKPIQIYEIHAGSWRKKTEAADGWYTYRELAPLLIPYLKENGYTHVELLPITEYPSDESWGYQPAGFYAPTSRYGTPDDLKSFIDQCHQAGIAVLLDFVPVHFVVNDYALWNFDGSHLFEYPHAAVGRSEWGTCNFMHSRPEVRSFLQSSAFFWLHEYHFDGLRMDAVGNLIYWQGNPARGHNRDAMAFLRTMNSGLKLRYPDVLLCAEDSSAYAGVAMPVFKGGLAFDLKWDLGWMNDTLSYFASSPEERPGLYHKLTCSMYYFYQDHYMLPLSHDEVVHGKKTIVDKMYGTYEEKFAQARALAVYMTAHPGKKLNFMGNEIAQFREWDEKREPDWDLLTYPIHDAFHRFVQNCNELYLRHPALYRLDYDTAGFSWVDISHESQCLYLFERTDGHERILCIMNLSDKEQVYHWSEPKYLGLLLASDAASYGGPTPDGVLPPNTPAPCSSIRLPAYTARLYTM